MSNLAVPGAERRRPAPAYFAAAAALTLWSGTPVANKVAVVYMDGLTAGVLRSMLAGLIALLIAVSLRLPFPAALRERLLLAVSGLSSFAVWPVFMSLGIERTSAGHAALIMALTPLFTVLLGAVAEQRAPLARWWLGALLALGGATGLIIGRGIAPDLFGPGAAAGGDVIVMAGAGICALGYVTGARLSSRIGTVATTFWGLAIALLGLVPAFAVIAPATAWADVPPSGWAAVGWMTVLSSLVGYALWFFALSRGGVARVGSLQLGVPVLTLAAAALVLGEAIAPPLLVGCVVVVSGTFIAHAAQHPA